jgi:uncharacterized protein YbjT (DUF2867 family)
VRNVLVVGATGYLGRRLVAELAASGCRVRALVRRPDQAAQLPQAHEILVGQVTEPESLAGIADGVDTVFSSLGITRQRDGVGYEQVDHLGDRAVLRRAERAGVTRFVYVSVLHGEEMRRSVALAAAKERFVDELRASPVASTVVRPTGFFSDMADFLTMARKGTVTLFGDGTNRMNPISGRDLARECIAAAESATGDDELSVGGPDVLTHEEIARLAFAALGRPARLRHVPLPLISTAVRVLSALSSQRVYGPVQFLAAVLSRDMVARQTGSDHLADDFASHLPGAPGAELR